MNIFLLLCFEDKGIHLTLCLIKNCLFLWSCILLTKSVIIDASFQCLEYNGRFHLVCRIRFSHVPRKSGTIRFPTLKEISIFFFGHSKLYDFFRWSINLHFCWLILVFKYSFYDIIVLGIFWITWKVPSF